MAPYLFVGILIALAFGIFRRGSRKSKEVPAVTQTQFTTPPDDIRNYRYCEIIPVFRHGVTLRIEVYNTFGLNEGPAELWNQLRSRKLAEAYGAERVIKNGPRYWVINELASSGKTAEGKTADFGGIEMILRGVVERKLWKAQFGTRYFVENEVQRNTVFTYRAGNMVYELTSPAGDVYRMQSYCQIFDKALTIDDLETLGERLELPEGWRYHARILTEGSALVADGLAFVVNDDLGNSYQKVNP